MLLIPLACVDIKICSFKEVRERMDKRKTKQQKEERRKKQKEKSDGQKRKIMVNIPYMRRVSEAVECTLRRHGIATAVRPYKTLCHLLVHPKDKRSVHESAGAVCYIPCRDCPMVYIGSRRDW